VKDPKSKSTMPIQLHHIPLTITVQNIMTSALNFKRKNFRIDETSIKVHETWRTNHQGIVPIREMLQASGDENKYFHPSKEYNGPFGQSLRYVPGDCSCWNCPICFNFETLEKPMKYAAFFGG